MVTVNTGLPPGEIWKMVCSIFYQYLYENEIFNLIKSLDLPPHLIELLLQQISDSKDKVYFGDTLDEFANYGKYILQK